MHYNLICLLSSVEVKGDNWKSNKIDVAKAHLLRQVMCYISQSDFSWKQILPKRWLSR